MYDLIIKNGLVIDPANGTQEKKDIYLRDGLFAEAPDPSSDEEIVKVIDASGCFVSPGWVDDHLHLDDGDFEIGADPDLACLPNGVTTAMDGGSAGPLNYEGFYRQTVVNQKITLKTILHPSPYGVLNPPYCELEDPAVFDIVRIKKLVKKYKDNIVGLKIRASEDATGAFGMEPIRKTIEISEEIEKELGIHLPVQVHFGELYEGVVVDDLANLLRPGDIFLHVFQVRGGETIFDENGKLFDSIVKARERGVLFDTGIATIHFGLENIRNAISQGFWPDILSTDIINRILYKKPCISQVSLMSMFLNLGMPLEEVIKAVTYTPAKAFDILDEAGTMELGKPADVTIFKL